MSAASPSFTSFEDYLVLEASSDVKHEWCDGVVYAMSRGTPEHGRLTMRIARAIGNAIGKDWCAARSRRKSSGRTGSHSVKP